VRTAASGLKAKPLKIHKPSALAVGLGGGVGAGVGSSVGSKVSGPPKPQQMPLGPKKPKPAGAIAKSGHDAFIGKGVKPWKPPTHFRSRKNAVIGNLTSRRAKTPDGETIGRAPKMEDEHTYKAATAAVYGAVGGSVGAVFTPEGRKSIRAQQHSQKLQRQINNNNRKLRKIEKRYTRITDVGTMAATRWPQAPKILGAAAAGLGTGAVATEGLNRLSHKGYNRQIKYQKKVLAQQKTKLSKSRVMSDAEIRRRKKVQGHISQTTSTLGLTSLGLLGASVATKKPGSRTYGALKRIPQLKKIETPSQMSGKLKDASLATSVTAGGIGGVGGYNFAAYTAAESKKKKQIHKSNVSAFGVEHD